MLPKNLKRRLRLIHAWPWISLMGCVVMLVSLFFYNDPRQVDVIICGTGALIALGGIAIFGLLTGLHNDDEKILELADQGRCVLLTAEQYLSLHQADHERYPLNYAHIMWDLTDTFLGEQNPIKMLNKEAQKLLAIIEREEDAKETAEQQAVCLDALNTMRHTLESHIAKVETENVETATKIQKQIEKITASDKATLTQGQVAQGM